MGGHRIRYVLAAGLLPAFLACQAPEENPDKHQQGRDPLDSLIGYYTGTIERTTCKQPMTDSCGLYETDTLPTGNLSLSLMGDSLVFFLQMGTFRVIPGDTVYADSADTVGRVWCFRLPAQAIDSGGPTYQILPGALAKMTLDEFPAVCRDSAGVLTPFRIGVMADPYLVLAPRRTFRLHHAENP